MCIGFIEAQFTFHEQDPGEVVALSHNVQVSTSSKVRHPLLPTRDPHTQGQSLSPPPPAPGNVYYSLTLDWPRLDISYRRSPTVAASVTKPSLLGMVLLSSATESARCLVRVK